MLYRVFVFRTVMPYRMASFLSRTLRGLLLMYAWALTLSGMGQQVLAGWTFPNDPDDALVDEWTPANAGATITTEGTNALQFTFAGATTRSARCTGWDGGSGSKWWEIEVNTQGYFLLAVSSKQRSSETGPRDFVLEYRVGIAGAWTPVPAAPAIVALNNWTSGILFNVDLPPACADQPSLFLRWIMTSDVAVNGGTVGSGGVSNMDDLFILAFSTDHFQTIGSGDWSDPLIWESSPTGAAPWTVIGSSPSHHSETITIVSGHTVTISSNVSMDQLTIEAGGTLNYAGGIQDLRNGPGVDMQVNGTFIDASPNATQWQGGATWALGTGATYIKASSTSAVAWRDNYQGGITSMAETAHWIIRRTGGPIPSSTAVGMVYPNLTLESFHTTDLTIAFAGAGGGYPTILGHLDVGGTGTNTVTLNYTNTNASPMPVLGDLHIRSGSTLNLSGTGITLDGDVTCDGTIMYSGTGGRRITFRESAPQSISGSGTFNAYDLIINKPLDDVSLDMSITVDHDLALLNGRILNHGTPHIVTMGASATVSNYSDDSFVTGGVRKLGNTAFTFPVGKETTVRPIGIGAGGSLSDSYVAEYFNEDPEPVYSDLVNLPLDHVSRCEHWSLEREVGSAARNVTLTWDLNSCGVTLPTDLRVAHFDGTAATPAWFDRGNTEIIGDVGSGSITSGPNSLFGPFTLASSSAENPLPVRLLDFSGKVQDGNGLLEWTTATERDNAFFDLLCLGPEAPSRSDTLVLGRIPGAGTSLSPLHYRMVDDRPGKYGTYQYRLRQVDVDGSVTLSPMWGPKIHTSRKGKRQNGRKAPLL